ncbi:MAG: MAPEG family protein [Pseudomonadota bacterium]
MNLITPLYASILALLCIALSVRTLNLRRRFGVAIGPGDEPLLARAVRAHGNFTEYVPLSLLLLLLLDLESNRDVLLHSLGLMLVVGRTLHAYGVSQVREDFRFRVAGMALTFTMMASCALILLTRYLSFA